MTSMRGYYRRGLSAERLRACYALAPPRVAQHLEAELAAVRAVLPARASVLELGCGYGRALAAWRGEGRVLVGIDTAVEGLALAAAELGGAGNVHLLVMDAGRLGFRAASFDVVACVQNGVSALGLPGPELLRQALSVLRPGGQVLLSTYAPAFFARRLEWFRRQAEAGLIGPLDEEASRDGVIVCRDGFRSRDVSEAELHAWAAGLPVSVVVREVDGSLLLASVRPRKPPS